MSPSLGRLTLAAAAVAVAACAAPPAAPRAPQVAQGVPGMDAEPLYRLARYLQGLRKDEPALRLYEQVLAIDPGHADALNAIGAIRSLRGEAEPAEAAFRRAIAEAPKSARGYNNLGYHLLRTGRPSEALTQLERARSLDARDEQVQVNIAMARHALEAPATSAAAPGPAAAEPAAPPEPAPPAPAMAAAAAPPNVPLRRVNDAVWELGPPVPAAAVTAAAVPIAVSPAVPVPVASAGVAAQAAVRVEVSNGHGATGLAREVSRLAAPGARLTNSRPFGAASSRVEYVAGAEQAARELEARLPVAVPLAPVARLDRRAGVRVLLGKDFPRHPAALARAIDEHRRVALTTPSP